jgi:hypothetical protein
MVEDAVRLRVRLFQGGDRASRDVPGYSGLGILAATRSGSPEGRVEQLPAALGDHSDGTVGHLDGGQLVDRIRRTRDPSGPSFRLGHGETGVCVEEADDLVLGAQRSGLSGDPLVCLRWVGFNRPRPPTGRFTPRRGKIGPAEGVGQ